MSSRFSELCIDCSDPRPLAEFWAAVLEWRIGESDHESVEIVDPDGGIPALLFIKVPEEKTVKNRLHIDVSPRDRDQAGEVERVLELGAKRADVGQGDDVSWVVLTDPEGNEFCILQGRRP